MMKAVKMQNAVHHREKKIHNNNANSNNSNHIDKLRCFDVAVIFVGLFFLLLETFQRSTQCECLAIASWNQLLKM